MINSFCRTTPGITVYLFLILVCYLSWAMGVYILLSPLYPDFSTYFRTVLSMISLDFHAIKLFNDLH